MSHRCVFLDRDNTIMDDPGYLTDASAVRLLPGADVALRHLTQAGYKLVVVTNQSAIARGLLTPEGLEKIHAELRRQLSQRGVTLDAIYYCPFHPEGSVEAYACESEERKPSPGMLLRAARDLDLDLLQSWMVGDSPRDVEAGQRAGCRTIRVRKGEPTQGPAAHDEEDVQTDYTVRNMVDAARIILSHTGATGVPPVGGVAGVSPATAPSTDGTSVPRAGVSPAPAHVPAPLAAPTTAALAERQILREILDLLRRRADQENAFSATRLLGAVFQVFALTAFVWGVWNVKALIGDSQATNEVVWWAQFSLMGATFLQLLALTFFIVGRR